MTEILAHESLTDSAKKELSNEYQHDSIWIVFKDFCILVS